MAKILVLYYSMYGHVETMANAVAEGARKVPGAQVDVMRIPETMDADRFADVGGKTQQSAPEATPEILPQYDAIIVGTPTRFGNMSGQMRTFWDRTGGLWASGALYVRRAVRQNRQRLCLNGYRRRPGANHYLRLDHPRPSRHGYRSDRLRHERDV